MTGRALAELTASYDDRWAVARAWRTAGGRVVGYVGADVPVELITAVGALPIRLAEQGESDRTAADQYLGTGIDPAYRYVLGGLLAETYPCDLLLISHECEATKRLFHAVRELRRRAIAPQLPETHLVDIVHLPHRTSATYNRVRVAETAALLERWAGTPITADALARSVGAHDRARAATRGLRERRATATLSGSDALKVIGAGGGLPVDRYLDLLERLVGEDAEPGLEGVRTFVTGSGHGSSEVYEQLEAEGLLIVGEDHDWGDQLVERDVGEPTLDAIAERYHYRGALSPRASIDRRAGQTAAGLERTGADLLLSYVRKHDDAPPWDFVAQRAVATGRGASAVLLARQALHRVDVERLRAERGAVSA